MQLISLTAPAHLLPPRSAQTLPLVALVGEAREADGRVEVTAHAAVPLPGGWYYFREPMAVTLARSAVAATQVIELPPRPQG